MKHVGYDPVSASLVIMEAGVFPPRTLTATIDATGMVRITSLADRTELYEHWSTICAPGGQPFGTQDALMAYLQGEFAKQRALPPTIATGDRVPGDEIGAAGDLYIDAVTGDLYRKET